MKRTGVLFSFRAAAGLCTAAAFLFSTVGCLKVINFEDRKDRIPPRDGAPDAPDMETEGGDVPVEADVPLDPDDIETGDVSEEPDTVEIEDVSLDPDAPDAAELPPGLVWVSIPAGAFEMGCSPGDMGCYGIMGEWPRHTVNVSAFRMTETEITQAQYEWVTGDTPSNFASCGASCPVEQVTWHEAKAFCEAIGGRLPSEAEWEYAARAGTTTRYYCGDEEACLDGIAWYYDGNYEGVTHPVGEKTANAFGLYDMLGNVWELVEDCWHSDYTGAPSTGEVWSGGDCLGCVQRGGSWDKDPWNLRASNRYWNLLGFTSKDLGLRCSQ